MATTAAAPEQVAPVVGFRACEDTPAAVGSTHLRPPAAIELPPAGPDAPGLSGPVRLQHVLSLQLPTGSVRAGSGADAVWALGGNAFALADGAVDAEVTAAVWAPGDVRQVAWLELSLGPTDPVRWETAADLTIVTDGGDGGFWSPDAPDASSQLPEDPESGDLGPAFAAYLATAVPDGGPYPTCVVRDSDGVDDGLVFPTGTGDGWYPTYAGYDAQGHVVSLLSDGGMDWDTAGVTGTPPPDYLPPEP
ncbi:uncharacterized protein DUF4241 [Kineococcus rhizosphaerae]|uniref:Uncharacterized protein DUF4241 n=1 Tax=Kineococcus rhizosphaerae TaxID=559628 RepID=A0A2T0R2D9_9ACTN|nr:uncharacterized protein DUF4241 [Kineococcus rhizosphaerae]